MVSVILTTYNRASFLRNAILSVLNQTFHDYELFILDNNSQDSTSEIVKSFSDQRINYIVHDQLSISQARNLGLQKACGEFISFLDDDDEWMPTKLEKQLEVFQCVSDDVCLVYSGFEWVDASGKIIRSHTPRLKGKILHELLWQKDPFTGSASNPMIRKSVYGHVGNYDETITTGEDWEFYLRLAERYCIEFSKDVTVRIRQHTGSRLGDKLADATLLEKLLLKRYEPIFLKDKKLKSFYYQKIGGKYIRMGNMKDGRAYIKCAIYHYPSNIVAFVQFLLSFFNANVYKEIHRLVLFFKRGF